MPVKLTLFSLGFVTIGDVALSRIVSRGGCSHAGGETVAGYASGPRPG